MYSVDTRNVKVEENARTALVFLEGPSKKPLHRIYRTPVGDITVKTRTDLSQIP